MTRKRKRLYTILGLMGFVGVAAAIAAYALSSNITYFYTPSDIVEQQVEPDRRMRLGGLVQEGSIGRGEDGVTITFRVTDTAEVVNVEFRGLLPDLFREGQGIVAEGALNANGTFIASEVLAKHDENYMPKEVADALKERGQWQGAN